jgi:hypothetical protein
MALQARSRGRWCVSSAGRGWDAIGLQPMVSPWPPGAFSDPALVVMLIGA